MAQTGRLISPSQDLHLPNCCQPCLSVMPSRDPQRGSQLSQLSQERQDLIMGLCYQGMLPTQDLLDLPPAAQDVCKANRTAFVSTDRGHIQGANDRMFDIQATPFSSWLASLWFDEYAIQHWKPTRFPDLIGSFVTSVKAGNYYYKHSNLCGQTICGYSNSALVYLQDRYIHVTRSNIAAHLRAHEMPYVLKLICQNNRWSKSQCSQVWGIIFTIWLVSPWGFTGSCISEDSQ